jgi:pyridoxal phosphate enzyme (YggS family)
MPFALTQPDEIRDGANALKARLDAVCARIAESARHVGRDAREIKLIAVSKTHPANVLCEAARAGAADFGENRVQEAETKRAEFERLIKDAEFEKSIADASNAQHLSPARWHLIGHLQANKARRAVRLFDVIHSLDSSELAARLERLCVEEGRAELPVLIQVDLAGEATKTGARVEALPALIETVKACAHLRLEGLMTLPPFFADAERVRPFFRQLRALRDEWQRRGAFGAARGELSMGMSHDFEIAVEEGATMVRVGTAIFGART